MMLYQGMGQTPLLIFLNSGLMQPGLRPGGRQGGGSGEALGLVPLPAPEATDDALAVGHSEATQPVRLVVAVLALRIRRRRRRRNN